jgi:hypothetical protein
VYHSTVTKCLKSDIDDAGQGRGLWRISQGSGIIADRFSICWVQFQLHFIPEGSILTAIIGTPGCEPSTFISFLYHNNDTCVPNLFDRRRRLRFGYGRLGRVSDASLHWAAPDTWIAWSASRPLNLPPGSLALF